jgi:hypothetical protein
LGLVEDSVEVILGEVMFSGSEFDFLDGGVFDLSDSFFGDRESIRDILESMLMGLNTEELTDDRLFSMVKFREEFVMDECRDLFCVDVFHDIDRFIMEGVVEVLGIAIGDFSIKGGHIGEDEVLMNFVI